MPSPVDPVAFSVGSVSIRWYALFILAGIVAGIWLIGWVADRRGMDAGFVLDAAPWVVFAALVGARLYYALLRADYFAAHPAEAWNIRLGGMTVHGALLFGTLTAIWFCRRHGERFLAWIDVVMPGVALAQAVGRWGNWANQEAFGRPTNLPWGVAIDAAHRPAEFAAATHFQPTFLYESIFDLLNAALLVWVALRIPGSRRLREGDGLWLYLVTYGTARFVIERMRTDSLYIGPFPAALWVSAALVLAGLGGLAWSRWRSPAPATRTIGGAPEV